MSALAGQTPSRHRAGPRRPPGVLPLWGWLIIGALAGGITGIGGYTFLYAQGTSYFSDDPQACVNCHVMRDVYAGWGKSSHKAVATCNDCHTPPDSIVSTYAVKSINGLTQSIAFTSDNYPRPIRITGMNRDVAQHNCLHCHGDLTAQMNHAASNDPTDCLRCHSRVGHDY